MRKRDNLLESGAGERAEPIVTYSRLTPDTEVSGDSRIEPHFTAVRVDGRVRPAGNRRDDDIDALPFVDAPPSDVSLDSQVEVGAGEIRVVRRRRGSRIAALAGILAIVAGAGVLAATYGGIVSLDNTFGQPAAAGKAETPDPAAVAMADVPSADTTGRSVRVVSTDQIPPFASETAALAPRAAADPVAGEAALSDQATVSGEAALSAEPPGRVIVDPPAPRLRPATASFNPPQPMSAGTDAMATAPVAPGMIAPVGVLAAPVDIDRALADVDRILLEQRAAAGVQGSGDGEFYADVPPLSAPQPLPYPALEPVPGGQQLYAVDPAVPGEPYGPYYPGTEPYPQQGYGAPQPLYPGVDLAAQETEQSPWWLPKRRALVIPNGPVPPADVPTGGLYGAW